MRLEKHTTQQRDVSTLPAEVQRLRVLIIDDNATNRIILRHQLASWGIHNDEVADGIQGLAFLRTAAGRGTPYNLIILDMQMPDMDGLTVARIIKTDP